MSGAVRPERCYIGRRKKLMAELPRGRRPLVISHAACKGHAPENTLAGIRAALDLGSDAVEIDVHLTADGIPVLLHDDLVERTTDGVGDVRHMTLASVQGLDAGARSFDGLFSGERVPALESVLDLTRGRALLVIEIKQRDIEQAVVDLVRRLGAADDVMVWSFHPAVVAKVRELAPEIPCGQLWSDRDPDPVRMCAVALAGNAQAVCPNYTFVTEALVRRALLHGLSVFTWTPDDPREIERLIRLGVDGVCSNYPDRVRAAASRITGQRAHEKPEPR
jgi:glycerophosphoryl diester phosphodiesterase